MNLPDNVTVEPGCIKLVSVNQIYANDHVQIWSIDASTKYYEVDHVSFFNGSIGVVLAKNQNTIKMDEDYPGQETEVLFHFDQDWDLFACNSTARYELRLCFHRANVPIEIQV